MAAHPQQKPIGGSAYRIADAYVWSAIYYLDSSTDFREYLPMRRTRRFKRASKLVLGVALTLMVVVAGLALLSRALTFG